MQRLLCTAAIALSMILPVCAATERPSLPATAKKLTGPEITDVYDSGSVKWTNFTNGATGTTTIDFKKGTQVGTWVMGKKKGSFAGTVRMNADGFCYKSGSDKEACVTVYLDGADIYAVNSKGTVESESQKQ